MGASVQIVDDGSLKVHPEGFEFSIRLNWYRSLPVACVEKIEFTLDGEEIPAGHLYFGINGHEYAMSELADKAEEFWFVQDSARIIARLPGKVTAEKSHNLAGQYDLRIPYIIIGPAKFLINVNRFNSTQVAG